MPYPEYIPTRVVSIGGAAVLESGSLLKIQVAIVSSRSLVWDATGYRFERGGVAVQSELGSEVQLILPRTDVPGWKDAATGAVLDVSAPDAYSHRYTATVRFADSNDRTAVGAGSYEIGPFVVPEGDGAIDLDKLVPASTVAGDSISIPDLWGQLVADAQAAASDAQAALVDSDTFIASQITTPGTETEEALKGTFARVLTPEAHGAVGDGTADDTAALVAMIAALQDGDTIKCAPGARYRYTSPLVIDSVDRWQWIGGTFLFAATAASSSGAVKALTIDGCSDFTMAGARFESVTQNREYDGILVIDSPTGLLDTVTAYNFRWVGIALNNSPGVSVRECAGLRCRFGAYTNCATKFIGGRYSSEWTQTQEYIDKGGVWDSTSLYYDGIIVSGATDWSIIGVTLDDNGQSGVYGGGGNRRGVIQGCNIFGNWNKGIDLGATGTKSGSNSLSHVAVTGNVLRDNATGDIHFRHVDQSSIVGNVVVRTGASDAVSAIILNGQSLGNAIVANSGSIANAAAAALFINAADGAIGNLLWNQIAATLPYTANTSLNAVLDSAAGLKLISALTQSPVVDFTGKAVSIAGRELIRGQNGTDTYYQVTVDKGLRIVNAGGTVQDLRAGTVTADTGLTVGSGSAFIADSATLRLPRTASTNAGLVWYDSTTGRLMWRDGVAAVNRDVAYAESGSSTNLNSVAAAINTTGKFAGKRVWNTTANRPVWATGATAASVWVYADGTTAHTPV